MSYYVYFISDGEYLKIGISNNPESRLRTLQTSNARPLEIIHVIPTHSKESALSLEGQLHDRLAEHRLSGEWFNMDGYEAIQEANKMMNVIDNRLLQQRFNSLVSQDIAKNYPPITHSVPTYVLRAEMRQMVIERRNRFLSAIEDEIDTLRNQIIKKV